MVEMNLQLTNFSIPNYILLINLFGVVVYLLNGLKL